MGAGVGVCNGVRVDARVCVWVSVCVGLGILSDGIINCMPQLSAFLVLLVVLLFMLSLIATEIFRGKLIRDVLFLITFQIRLPRDARVKFR